MKRYLNQFLRVFLCFTSNYKKHHERSVYMVKLLRSYPPKENNAVKFSVEKDYWRLLNLIYITDY